MKTPQSISSFLLDCHYLINEVQFQIKELIEKKYDNPKFYITYNKFLENLRNLDEYRGLQNDSNEVSGKFGVLGVLSSLLSSIGVNKYLNEDDLDIMKAIQGRKIIIINVSSFSDNILNIFNAALYDTLSKRVSNPGELVPLTVFIDEAQKVLSPDYLPNVDVCRENKFEYIFATQDELLLASRLSSFKTTELLRNIIFQVSFKTNDISLPETMELKRFEYIDLRSNKKYLSNQIFFEERELLTTELRYQKSNKDLQVSTENSEILIYDPVLSLENKVLVKNIVNGELNHTLHYFSKIDLENAKNNILSYEISLIPMLRKNDASALNEKLQTLYNTVFELKKSVREQNNRIDKLTNQMNHIQNFPNKDTNKDHLLFHIL